MSRTAHPKPIVLLSALCLGLALACIFLGWRLMTAAAADIDLQAALEDPRVRNAVISKLVSNSTNVFDSHPDPDVGRVLLPDLDEVEFAGAPVSSNAWGMRERDYELPKPAGVVRVVLLGDSYVFGLGAEAQDRVGVFLEDHLASRTGGDPSRIEVLHVGIGSWSAVAECEYLRRQLSELQPDLVLHVLIPNDLDDTAGIRGFGARSTFSDRVRERADAMVYVAYPRSISRTRNPSFLIRGIDWESRHRFDEMVAYVTRLAEKVEEAGGRYLMIGHWASQNVRLERLFSGKLREDQLLYLPPQFEIDERYRISEGNAHWNREGHEMLAKVLFTVIRQRDLLPVLELEPWPEMEKLGAELAAAGMERARREVPPGYWGSGRPVARSLDFRDVTPEVIRQVSAGVDGEGLVGPYASIVLKNAPNGALRLRGRALDRPEIDGAHVAVYVEELPVGEFSLESSREIDFQVELPPEVAGRPFVCARLEADDYVYVGQGRRHCVAFRLETISIAPR